MGDHKSVAIIRQCIKGPSTIQIRKQRKTAENSHQNRLKRVEPDLFRGDTLDSLLTYTDGDTLKASRLLEARLSDSRAKIATLTSEATSSGGGDDFEAQLTALKAEHKRTVDLCEGLYYLSLEQQKQKKQPRQQQPQKTVTFRPSASAAGPDASHAASAEFIRASLAQLESRVLLDAKPPLSKTKNLASGLSEDRAWPPTTGSSESGGIGVDDDSAALRQGYQELLKSKVKSMWSDFDVSDARGDRLRRSGSLDHGLSGPKVNSKRGENGAKQLGKTAMAVQQPKKSATVPEPFTMTLRDSTGGTAGLRKSRSMLQFEAEQRRRQEDEEAACRVRFHANPVPAHVRMPLFDELTEQREARRRELQSRSRDLLRSTERPFNFADTSAERPSTAKEVAAMTLTTAATFRANPVPPSSSSGEAVIARQRLHQEDELLRQIKIKMRSEETIKRSATPGEMATRQRRMEEARKARLAKYGGDSSGGGSDSGGGKHPRRPRSADAAARKQRRNRGADPPDFKRLHWAFGQEVLVSQQRQPPVRATQPKPFQLRTEQRGQRPASASAASDQRRQSFSGLGTGPSSILGDFAGRTQRALVRHEEAPPARLTQSAMLREARLSAERQAAERRRTEAKTEAAKREALRRELAGSVRQSVEMAAANSGPSIQETTRRKLESQRELEEAYKQRLQEMKEKMKQRDLLVVQQAKLIAQQKAQAKYRKTLEEAGVDPKEVDANAKKYQEGDLKSYTQDFDADSADDFGDENGSATVDLGATRRRGSASPLSDAD